MKLFCKHHYIQIGEWNVPDLPNHVGSRTIYIMCNKCGKYKEVKPHKWGIMKVRQQILEADK